VSAQVTVQLNDATDGAKAEFEGAIQAFARSLADEAQRQEFTSRPSGVTHLEVTANSVVRAKQVLDRYGTRAKPAAFDRLCLGTAPLAGSATGVLGSYLQHTLALIFFVLSAAITVFVVVILGLRRLL
jgi:hypothetical protein